MLSECHATVEGNAVGGDAKYEIVNGKGRENLLFYLGGRWNNQLMTKIRKWDRILQFYCSNQSQMYGMIKQVQM